MSVASGAVKRKANTTEDWRENVKQMTTPERNYYQYMLDHDILTDCTFVVGPEDGDTREFKAHRVHIARMSSVFEAMLLRCEMSEAKTGHVRVTDLSPNTFQLLLSSMYGREPVLTSFQEAQDLAFTADKYQMMALLEHCVSRMCALISASNIWTVFETADLLQNKRLQETCVEVLQRNTLRCITDPGFMQVSEENVALLLEQNELNVEDELLLMIVIVHWARHAARQRGLSDNDEGVRAVLKPRLLSLLRFLAMSPQQFMVGPCLESWLTQEEKSAIFQCLMRSKDAKKLPQHFSAVAHKRKNPTDAARAVQVQAGSKSSKQFICRREIIGFRPNVHNMRDNRATSIFKINRSCKLLGIQCSSRCRIDPNADPTALLPKNPVYQECFCVGTYTFNNTLSTDFQKISLGKSKKFEQKIEYNSSISIMFDKPRLLVPDTWYAVEVAFLSYSRDFYPNHLRSGSVCTAAGVEFTFRTEQQDGYYTSVNDGLIEAFFLSR